MQRKHNIDFLKNKCANCVIKDYKCFFVKFIELIELV